jgi:hypothetical protein
MGKAEVQSFAVTKPLITSTTKIGKIDEVGDLNRCENFHCNRLDKDAPRIMKYNDFMFFFHNFFVFFVYFSGNREAVEPRVAQTCMMAQTTRSVFMTSKSADNSRAVRIGRGMSAEH